MGQVVRRGAMNRPRQVTVLPTRREEPIMNDLIAKRIRLLALGLVAITVGILLIFAIGEVGGGDIFGLQHLLQAVPLVVVAWFAWRNPLWGGITLITVSLILAGLYVVFFNVGSLAVAGVVLALFCVPPFLAGVLFVVLAQRAKRDGSDQTIGAPLA